MMAARRTADLRGIRLRREPLSRHTSWRVGGPADTFYTPADLADLAQFLAQLPEGEPVIWLGLGSNVLVRDGGVRGTVIVTSGALTGLALTEAKVIRAEAGVACAKVARFCANEGLVGAEFLAGIPGTMGGALAMNAGAFGTETWQRVESVETIDRRGSLRVRSPQEFKIAYRHVEGVPGEWFAAAHLHLQAGDTQASRARIKELLDWRNTKQPTGVPSCGSVFRNPPGDFAGRLVEACGLKGHCIGGACVSEKHANFIVNTGDATAQHIEQLIAYVRQQVREQLGVDLVPEVHIIGEHTA